MRSIDTVLENLNGVDPNLAFKLLHHHPGMWFANVPDRGLLKLLQNPYVFVDAHARVDGARAVLKRPFELSFATLVADGDLKFMVASGTTGHRPMSIFMARTAAPAALLAAAAPGSVHPHEPLSVGVVDPHVEAQVHVGGSAEAADLLYLAATNPDAYVSSLNALDQVQGIGGATVPAGSKYVFLVGENPYKISYSDSEAGAIVACNLNRGTIEDAGNPLHVTLTEVIVKPYP